MVYRIISFDGGGVRGAYTTQLLAMLFQEIDLFKQVDLFVGTSTGSLIALGLGMGYSPEQLVGLYTQFAPLIFSLESSSSVTSHARYKNQHLKELFLAHVFVNNPSLADLAKEVIIPVFKLYEPTLGRWQPTCFHNFDRKQAKNHAVVDVALAACAAPLFFPSYQGYIDGGVFVNNPSMFGICQALKHSSNAKTLEEIKLFSLGTLMQPMAIREEVSWGVEGWSNSSGGIGYPLFSLITEGVVDVAHEQCEQILGLRYHRLNPLAKTAIGIDEAGRVPELVELAKKLPYEDPLTWKETLLWLKKHF